MNIPKVGTDKFYFEVALRQSKKGFKLPRYLKGIRKAKYQHIERIKSFVNHLAGNIISIERSFPSVDTLDIFYIKLIDNNIGSDKMKQALARIKGTIRLIRKLEGDHLRRVRKSESPERIKKEEKAFLGRVSSTLKKISKDLEFLEKSRKEMRKFPSIKTNIKTVCIAGYPNVGKSTLLRKITTAKPEINIYPFTTKGLMMGYVDNKLQVIDTPGTFRDKKSMNMIEMQAYLALKYLADSIIFVIDYTESCGYSIDMQEKLLDNLKKEFKEKKILKYLSKTDMMDDATLKRHSGKEIFSDAKKLREFLLKK